MNTSNFQNALNAGLQNFASQIASIGLKQINGFDMVKSFQDSDGRQWRLVKSAKDSSVEIPDPAYVQITDYWNHEFPNTNGKVYIYVVEGIKRPRIETESAVMVLYQWFSTNNNPNFTPQLITPQEWYSANVYTASISDARVSKLHALCKTTQQAKQPKPEDDIDISLIRGGSNERAGNERAGKNDKSDPKSHKD